MCGFRGGGGNMPWNNSPRFNLKTSCILLRFVLHAANNQSSDNLNNGGGLLSCVLLFQMIFTFRRWSAAEVYFRRRRALFIFSSTPLLCLATATHNFQVTENCKCWCKPMANNIGIQMKVFKSKKILWSPGFIQKYFIVVRVNPLTAKLFNLNFHPLEVVSRQNYSDLTKCRSTFFQILLVDVTFYL